MLDSLRVLLLVLEKGRPLEQRIEYTKRTRNKQKLLLFYLKFF